MIFNIVDLQSSKRYQNYMQVLSATDIVGLLDAVSTIKLLNAAKATGGTGIQ